MLKFIPLHAHLAYGSIGDSILKTEDYVKKAKDLGLSSIAITDHGSLNEIFDFYDCCKKENIKPIIGCEVYVCNDRLNKKKIDKDKDEETLYNHLVLIAKNNIGVKNLLYIVSDANLQGFYYKPRTDLSVLKNHGEGIIALSACVAGEIPQMILKKKIFKTKSLIKTYKKIFDEFYLEIQPGEFDEQLTVNKEIVKLSESTDTPLIVTNDIHYLDEEDWFAHAIHVKMYRKQKLDDDDPYPDTCYYFMDTDTLKKSLNYLPKDKVVEAIKNTNIVAEQCDITLAEGKTKFPKVDIPDKITENGYLFNICYKQLKKKFNKKKNYKEYLDRFLYEIKTISALGFSGYFLTIKRFIDFMKENKIPHGPGRGSVAGSLVAYLAGITKIDPIKYNLLFERFLSIFRKTSNPDVDVDISSKFREMVFRYAVEEYGIDNCALVSAFTIRKAKSALRDTARVYNIDSEIVDAICELILTVWYTDDGDKETDLSIVDSIKFVPELKKYYNKYKDWFDIAIKLEGLPSHVTVHPAGTLISPVPLKKYIPMINSKNDFINATSLNLKSSERARFIKYDFLGVASLQVIAYTEDDTGDYFDYDNDEYNDEKVWDLIGSKFTTGIFQIGSKTYKVRMPRLRPTTIPELANCLALVRSPCIRSHMDEKYMKIIEGEEEIELIHPLYDEVTKNTYGILLFQEQVMELAVAFGFTLEDGFDLMKATSKKNFDKIKSFEKEFYKKAKIKNVSKKIADKIWKIILDMGSYAFNISHAVAYAVVVYCMAYHKVYHPLEFITNTLTNEYERNEEIKEVIYDCKRMGFELLPPDINKSDWRFKIENGKIRIGFSAIKSFGEKAWLRLKEVRDKKSFKSFDDFVDRTNNKHCNKKAITALIYAAAFHKFEEDRTKLYKYYIEKRKEKFTGKVYLFNKGGTFNASDSYSSIEKIIYNTDIISSPVNSFESVGFDNVDIDERFKIKAVVDTVKKIKDKNKNDMAFLNLNTADGPINAVVFYKAFDKYRKNCKEGKIVEIVAEKTKDDSCKVIKIIA